jgi:hypothetical protein
LRQVGTWLEQAWVFWLGDNLVEDLEMGAKFAAEKAFVLLSGQKLWRFMCEGGEGEDG